jgi:tetratricopeptide (TPR) repeat protein
VRRELYLNGLIEEIQSVNKGYHTRKFCFVLGAGASVSSGIPSGQRLVDTWDRELKTRNAKEYEEWKKAHNITESNKYNHYSTYYDERFGRIPSDGYGFLEQLMENIKPSAGYVMLAYILAETKNKIVVTTNFDHLIEDAVNYYTTNMPLVIGHEGLAHYIPKEVSRPIVVKIHRDLLLDPANRPTDIDALDERWKNALDSIFSGYHPVFIGYAGNDNSLMNYLCDNMEKFKNNELCCPYWMLYKNDGMDERITKFLDESSGYFIRHEGFDEVMVRVGAALECKIASEEKFISDAKERYQAVAKTVVELMSKEQISEIEIKEDGGLKAKTAEPEFNQAIQKITEDMSTMQMYNKASSLSSNGRYAEALPIMQKLIEEKSDDYNIYILFGDILRGLKQYDEANEAYENAGRLSANEWGSQFNVWCAFKDMERYDDALPYIQKAVELYPEYNSLHYHLGNTLYMLEQYDKALAAAQRAVELAPNDGYNKELVEKIIKAMEQKEESTV